MIIKRDVYLNMLIASKHVNLIKVITGLRRSGKSYLLDPIYTNHYNLSIQTKLTSRTYASELEVLCKFNGASWHYEGPFWRVDKAW